MAKLGVNVDHVATLRQARGGQEPDPVIAAARCEMAGADSIVAHLREDRRHIQDRDLTRLRESIHTRLDMEMAATDEMVGIACDLKPEICTVVPERRAELTTEGGLDVAGQHAALAPRIRRLREAGIVVSLFVEPSPEQIKASRDVGANFVELHTGTYANLCGADQIKELARIREAALLADALGLGVNAGHGLNYHNIQPLVAIPQIQEYNIGHSIMARAVFHGLERAVADMRALIPRHTAEKSRP
ncbi:MAG: pyridoxine 5'-phosphate synthase [Nitrospirota bacterium]|nr:pyridoxine 5'-phosphate synthase [Nitrospirota bacterium]